MFGAIFSVGPVTNTFRTQANSGVTEEILLVNARQRQGPVLIHIKILNVFGSVPGQPKDYAFNALLLLLY